MDKIKQILIILTIFLLVNPIFSKEIILAAEDIIDESFVEIENIDALVHIKDDLTRSYLLTDDIDLKDTEWEPIQGEFTGKLKGNDFIIKNMPVEYLEDVNFGLFTEVEDIDSIDVEIEFVEQEINEVPVEESYIVIENSDALINIQQDLTKNYILTKDINLIDAEWELIQGEFTGTLTGNGFIIQNMPTKYLEHENCGLFEEVENLDNIDVEVEFMEEGIGAPQFEEELVEESYILIENSDQLINIKEGLTENYILTKNIDLIDAEWEPMDYGIFTGTLTGNNFTIQNMPIKYLEYENFGLFTEVEDLNNIDVKVEFTKEEIYEPQEEELTEEGTDELQVEEETEEHQSEEELNEEEINKSPVEEEKIEKDSEEIDQQDESTAKDEETIKGKSREENQRTENRAIVSKDVYNHGDLKDALESSTITEINLKGDISKSSQLWNRIDIAPKIVVINGNGHKLEQTNSGLNYAMFRANLKIGKKTQITFKNINLVSLNNNSIITQTGDTTDWVVIFENINEDTKIDETTQIGNFDGRLVNATNAHVEFKKTIKFITKQESIIAGARSVTVDTGARVSLLTRGLVYETSHGGAKLHVKRGGELLLFGNGETNISAVELKGANSEILVEGLFAIGSDRKVVGEKAGLIRLAGANSKFTVVDGATVGFSHAEGSILYMKSENGEINISGKGTSVKFLVQAGNGEYDAPIHLHAANNYELNVSDQALFEVVKEGGQSMGIRVGKGNNHKVNVTSGARLSILNEGNGNPANPQGNEARNQALYFDTLYVSKDNLPRLKLDGEGSELVLIANSGVAIHMTNGGHIEALTGTSFIAHGKTLTATNGVIDTGGPNDIGSTFTMDNPAFYDFRNNNTRGFIFLVGNNSEFKGINTDVAVWKRGPSANLDGKHNNRWVNVNYKFKGISFQNIIHVPESEGGSDNLEDVLGKDEGLKKYARLSGNNARPVVNKLYQPTNADGKVYAHVSINEGIFGTRNAYSDEVEVKIEVKEDEETILTKTGDTIGKNHDKMNGKDVYEIYGKKVDENIGVTGWAEIELDEGVYLEAGDTVEVTGAKIKGTEQVIESGSEDLPSNPLTVIDVTPPEPTVIDLPFNNEESRYELTSDSNGFQGTLPTVEAEESVGLFVKINTIADGELTYDGNRLNNAFEYTFQNDLVARDKIQVSLKDSAMRATDQQLGPQADRPDRPKTHTDSGNINPSETFIYHDKEFVQAPTIFVVGVLKFISKPDQLNFKVKIKSYAAEYLVDTNSLGNDLIVSDDRLNKSGWHITARMHTQLDSETDKELINVLFYRSDEGKVYLTGEDSIIKSHKYDEETKGKEIFNVSSDSKTGWGKGENGIFIEIEPGVTEADNSSGITWTLHNTP